MQKLKSENIIHLTDSILKTLAQNRVTTILEFLQEDVDKLLILTKLSLPQILETRNEILKKYSAPFIRGSSMLVKSFLIKTFTSTGIENLDKMLEGGIPKGYITELCGLAESGKTQLCFQLAMNCAKQKGQSVLYIDTKGDFSAVRLQNILQLNGYSFEDMASIMCNIKVVHAWTIDEVIDVLKRIKNKDICLDHLSLIIIDSLPSLMFQYLGDENKIGLTLLNSLVNYSRFLSKELNLSMLSVNLQTRWVEQDVSEMEDEGDPQSNSVITKEMVTEKRNRCLGRYWQNIPALVLQLEKNQDKDENGNCCTINVKVIKSEIIQWQNRTCSFKLACFGITE